MAVVQVGVISAMIYRGTVL